MATFSDIRGLAGADGRYSGDRPGSRVAEPHGHAQEPQLLGFDARVFVGAVNLARERHGAKPHGN
jgi:hypothetical protein